LIKFFGVFVRLEEKTNIQRHQRNLYVSASLWKPISSVSLPLMSCSHRCQLWVALWRD